MKVLHRSGLKAAMFHVHHIEAGSACYRKVLNFGRDVTHVFMIAFAMSDSTLLLIGRLIGTTRSLSP